ncbi:Gypsy retrotransposon integrase-like protein 1 [Stygiomarasmius scandens]|uniref:Gypsy retrotransposon integrase-like protein 1 n=1 Tax=Marasmiellus scandens TaxID=2682957 RepID=A0ABR1JF00_9AGAR
MRRKRGPKIGAPPKADVKATVAAILSDKPTDYYVIPEDRNAVRQVLVDLANYIQYLEKEVTRARRKEALSEISSLGAASTSGSSPQSVESVDDSDYSETEVLSEQVANLKIARMQDRHFGKSSNVMFLLKAFDVKEVPDVVKRPEYWYPFKWQLTESSESDWVLFDFPEENHLQELINFYFAHLHPYFPLLHRKSFECSVYEGLHRRNRRFGSLVLALCSIASRGYGDSRSLPEQACSNVGLGWRWFKQLTLVRTTFHEPVTLYELQTYCLACLFLQTTSLSDTSWVLNGFAIRLAQERGLHRRKDLAGKPTLERELWKRAFRQLIALDTISSVSFGRPRATLSEDFDIEPLIECDEDAWDDPEIDVSLLSPVKDSPSAFFNCYMKLLEIIGFGQRALFPVKRLELAAKMGTSSADWTQKAVMEVDSALNSWMDNIPSHLKWDPHCENGTFFTQSVTLYATYYFTQILVHRSFIPRPGEASVVNFPSMAICANAARSCLHVIESYSSRRQSWSSGILVAALFNASIVLLLNAFRGKELKLNFDPQKELKDVLKCVDILRGWEDRHPLAGRLNDVVKAIASIRVPLPNQSKSLKRPRETEESSTQPPPDTADGSDQRPMAPSLAPQPGYNPYTFTDLNSESYEVPYRSDLHHFTLPLTSSELGGLPLHQPLHPSEVASGSDAWSALPTQEEYPLFPITQQPQQSSSQYPSSIEQQSRMDASFSDWANLSAQSSGYELPQLGPRDRDDINQSEWDDLVSNIDHLFQWHTANGSVV